MKNGILRKFSVLLLCVTMLLGLSATALASTFYEYEDNNGVLPHTNDTIAAAQLITVFPNSSSSYNCYQGTIKDNTDVDYYKFLYQSSQGSNGRFAIKLEGIQTGNNYNLELVDQNNNVIFASKRTGNQNEIVRIPANTLVNNTHYYLKVTPVTAATPGGTYRILFENNIQQVTKAVSGSPTILNSLNGQKSNYALADMRNACSDPNAKVLSVSVSAVKGAANNGYNYVMYVTPFTKYQQGQWYTAQWNSEVTGLRNAGVLLKDSWYIAFSAQSITPGVDAVSIKSPKLTFTYEYDTTAKY